MVPEVNSWLFESGRKVGDTAIVFNDGSYVGYHVVYYAASGAVRADTLAENELKNTAYSEWYNGILEGYESKLSFAAKLVK